MLCANAKQVYFNSIWRAGCVFLFVGCGFRADGQTWENLCVGKMEVVRVILWCW